VEGEAKRSLRIKMTQDHRSGGFMTQQAHMLGAVLMLIMIVLLLPLLSRWIESPLLVFVAFILLFVPVFVISHWLADVLLLLRDTFLRGNPEETVEEENRPKTRGSE
jgi:uncharacterized membrane protein